MDVCCPKAPAADTVSKHSRFTRVLTSKEAPLNMIVFSRWHLLIRRVYYTKGQNPFGNLEEIFFFFFNLLEEWFIRNSSGSLGDLPVLRWGYLTCAGDSLEQRVTLTRANTALCVYPEGHGRHRPLLLSFIFGSPSPRLQVPSGPGNCLLQSNHGVDFTLSQAGCRAGRPVGPLVLLPK